jgi:type IV secretion system protein VirB9
MKNKFKCTLLSLLLISNCFADNLDSSLVIDSRIKTFVYSENEVFPIVLTYGYQTSIEFMDDEVIQTYSIGNNFAWQISPSNQTLFIKPLEENINTNMTVITNKRRYYFELYSNLSNGSPDEETAYVIRFFYPGGSNNLIPQKILPDKQDIPINSYNFNYVISPSNSEIILACDNGVSTMFKLANPSTVNNIIMNNGKKIQVQGYMKGDYLIVNNIGKSFQITLNNKNYTVSAQQ